MCSTRETSTILEAVGRLTQAIPGPLSTWVPHVDVAFGATESWTQVIAKRVLREEMEEIKGAEGIDGRDDE